MGRFVDGHKIGVTRAIKGTMNIKAQEAALPAAGVHKQAIWRIESQKQEDIIQAFRSGKEVLFFPFLGVLGKHCYDLLKAMAGKEASLLDFCTGIMHDISQAGVFAAIKEACTSIQTALAREASRASPNKTGR